MAFDLTSQRHRKCLLISFALTILIICWGSFFFSSRTTIPAKTVIPYAQALLNSVAAPQRPLPPQDLTYIARHVRTPTFTYAHRTIRTRYVTARGERLTLTRVHEPLFGPPHILSKTNLTALTIDSPDILTLDVPISPKVDTSIFSFGIATKIPRLQQALPQLQHWLPSSSAQLHVSIPPENWSSLSSAYLELETSFRQADINLTLHASDLPFAKAYFSLIKVLYEARTTNTQWLVLIDDDTFVPSLPYLAHHLNTNYDASNEVMVAALSDNLEQIQTFGLMPFGGGGIFISVPLAASLTKPEVWDACLADPKTQGDQVVNDCLNDHSSIRPSFDHGLNQMDVRGDMSGYFESGRPLLTIHHWKTWYHVDIPMAANVSKACGFECLFQRWTFTDNTVLSNGYSVVEYPHGFDGLPLEEVERTWEGEWKMFIHHMSPLREPMGREVKRSARLVETVDVKEGIRQVYIERMEDGEDGKPREGAMDRVVEIVWLF